MTVDPIVRICDACDQLVDDLDDLLNRILRNDPVLSLRRHGTREWEARWTVVDLANGNARMLPPTTRGFCERFAVAFREKHPGTTLDDSFGLFSTLPGEPNGGARAPLSRISDGSPTSQPVPLIDAVASPGETHSVRVPLAPVIPIRQGA